MRTKLLSALLLASTAITGIASASPIVRDHRQPQPTVVSHPQPQPQRHDRDHDGDHDDAHWSGGVQVTSQPSWMPQVNYGFQVSYNNQVTPYTYGNDPYVEGIARGEWYTLNAGMYFYNEPSGVRIINLNGRSLQALELQAASGCTDVSKITVRLSDGRAINFDTNRQLDEHSPNLRIDLGSAARVGIDRVLIAGSGTGTVRVLGA